ncbi:hypothetical protein DdX_08742 [Ditylenchus destructor]|uniref:Uncharacterized protein n=1 Tax=Ditylenchus destructor TaxID=166010 RepID=A0AAD4N1Z5_9BILA|nr:hypothetical protein DdX_08742 [Ditylenchus destructor]
MGAPEHKINAPGEKSVWVGYNFLWGRDKAPAVETTSVPVLFNEVQSSVGCVQPATAVETVSVPELGRLLQRNAPAVETVQSPICTMGSSPQSKWAIDNSGRNCLVPELGCIRKNTGSCHCKNINAKETQ